MGITIKEMIAIEMILELIIEEALEVNLIYQIIQKPKIVRLAETI